LPEKSSVFDLFEPDRLVRIVGVHCALSAKLAHLHGARALWASSLGMSSVKGLRDANELSWTEAIQISNDICTSQPAPLILDGDNGYGDFNNARLLALRAHKVGVAGIAIEDKPFPKINSFAGGEQELTDVGEFTDKIRAIKDALGDTMFVVARTEAFICGKGAEEAVRRADAYVSAGADALIVHSKAPDTRDIAAFRAIWLGKTPLIVIPTTFLGTTEDEYKRLRVGAAIFANVGIRAAAEAMAQMYRSVVSNPLSEFVRNGPPMLPLAEMIEMFGLDHLRRERSA
jgi:phosphoenolpyruvate phosphomutase